MYNGSDECKQYSNDGERLRPSDTTKMMERVKSEKAVKERFARCRWNEWRQCRLSFILSTSLQQPRKGRTHPLLSLSPA